MKKLLSLFAFLALGQLLAQNVKIEGTVHDAATREPLPFASVTYNDTRMGTSTDIDGKFFLEGSIKKIAVSFVGYDRTEVEISREMELPMKIYLKPKSEKLAEVTVMAGTNPAWRIINNTVKNRDKNNPEQLERFTYTSYNKLHVTFDIAQDAKLYDTTTVPLNDTIVMFNIDSSAKNLQRFVEDQHLFLMESISERSYSKPNKNTERVVASRVSGLKNPSFVLLATQLASFSFYSNYIQILGRGYLNPISPGSVRQYVFIIEDTITQGLDSTFIVRYFPKPDARYNGMKGTLSITTDGWALTHVTATPYDSSGIEINIQQKYQKFGKHYFPYQMHYDFVFKNISVNKTMPIGVGRTYLEDVNLNPDKSEMKHLPVELKVEDRATDRDNPIWDKYAHLVNDPKRVRTYELIDSLGEEVNLERKLEVLNALTRGKIRYNYLDFDLGKVLRYNFYEGIRLGLGAETNDRLVKNFSVNGYFAYGFGDRMWKYGYGAQYTLSSKYQVKIGGGYALDIFETGNHKIPTERPLALLAGDPRFIFVEQFNERSRIHGYLTWHPRPNLHARFQVNRDNTFVVGDYRYLWDKNGEGPVLQNGFNTLTTTLFLEYAPRDRYMEDKFGRRPIFNTHPSFGLGLTQGHLMEGHGEFEFTRINFRTEHKKRFLNLGYSLWRIDGGITLGDVPVTELHYGLSSIAIDRSRWQSSVSTQYGFETMPNNRFLSDRFAALTWRHNFEQKLFRLGKNSEFAMVNRAYWGMLDNVTPHLNLPEFTDARLGYFESGLELFRLYKGLGVGVYYRYGPYNQGGTWNDVAIKITSVFSF